jgi:hypothetical protein
MNKTKLSIGVILVFLVGVLAGSLGMGMYLKHRLKRFEPGGPPPPPHLRHDLIMKRLSRKLDLTPAQRVELKKILEESEIKISAIRDQFMPKIEEVADQSFAAMKEKLNADQQKRLERIKEKIDNRFAKAIMSSFTDDNTPKQTLSKLKKHLHLTKKQIIALQPIIEEDYERLEKAVEKYRGQQHPKIRFLFKEIRELRKSTDKKLENLLTETQMERYREIERVKRFEMYRKSPPPDSGSPID